MAGMSTKAERAAQVRAAIRSTELEGGSVSAAWRVEAQDYIEGASVEEMIARAKARVERRVEAENAARARSVS